jgi:gas vesicle protein
MGRGEAASVNEYRTGDPQGPSIDPQGSREGGIMIRFVLGLVSGVAIGAAAANLSQSQSGQDIRAEFDRIRNDLQERNFDAVGAHLEERFKELQANLEERFAEVQKAADEADDTPEEAIEEAEAVIEEAAEEAKLA